MKLSVPGQREAYRRPSKAESRRSCQGLLHRRGFSTLQASIKWFTLIGTTQFFHLSIKTSAGHSTFADFDIRLVDDFKIRENPSREMPPQSPWPIPFRRSRDARGLEFPNVLEWQRFRRAWPKRTIVREMFSNPLWVSARSRDFATSERRGGSPDENHFRTSRAGTKGIRCVAFDIKKKSPGEMATRQTCSDSYPRTVRLDLGFKWPSEWRSDWLGKRS